MCGLDCNLVRSDSQISNKNPVSCIFVGQKKLITEKNHICRKDVLVPENLILFFFGLSTHNICFLLKKESYLALHFRCINCESIIF